MKFLARISESTVVPISFVIIIIGGVLWLGDMHSTVTASAAEITSVKKQTELTIEMYYHGQLETIDKLNKIDSRLSRIEGKLEQD